jgi:hypothetical protein
MWEPCNFVVYVWHVWHLCLTRVTSNTTDYRAMLLSMSDTCDIYLWHVWHRTQQTTVQCCGLCLTRVTSMSDTCNIHVWHVWHPCLTCVTSMSDTCDIHVWHVWHRKLPTPPKTNNSWGQLKSVLQGASLRSLFRFKSQTGQPWCREDVFFTVA